MNALGKVIFEEYKQYGDSDDEPGSPLPKTSGDSHDTPATLNRKLKEKRDF